MADPRLDAVERAALEQVRGVHRVAGPAQLVGKVGDAGGQSLRVVEEHDLGHLTLLFSTACTERCRTLEATGYRIRHRARPPGLPMVRGTHFAVTVSRDGTCPGISRYPVGGGALDPLETDRGHEQADSEVPGGAARRADQGAAFRAHRGRRRAPAGGV